MKTKAIKWCICTWMLLLATPAFSQLQVWPGDANNDGVVNTIDVLYIGLGYNTQGIARNTQSIVWQAEAVTPWSNVLPDSTNYAYLDCDGNGFLNEDDLVAVGQNYGLTHGNIIVDSFPEPDSLSPIFYMSGLPDSIIAGQWVQIDVFAGTNTLPAEFFGLSFHFDFDTSYIVESSVVIAPDTTLNSPVDRLLFLTNNAGTTGTTAKLEVALSKRANSGGTSGTPIVLVGQRVATITFIIEDNLIGKTTFDPLVVSISEVNMLSQNMNKTTAEPIEATIPIKDYVAVETSPQLENLKIYPQPASNLLIIDGLYTSGQFTLTDISGRKIMKQAFGGGRSEMLDCSGLEHGLYLLHIQTAEGSTVRKVLID